MNLEQVSRHTKIILMILFCFSASEEVTVLQAQSLVIDAKHTAAKGIQAFWAVSSAAFKRLIESPAWKKISEVQEFLQDASTIISKVVKNLKMTKELIAIEEEIYESLRAYYSLLQEAENFPTKFIHHRSLLELWYEAGKIFEVFDFASIQRRAVLNDEGRIILIKDALIRAKQIRSSMRIIMKKARKDLLIYQKRQKDLEGFTKLFGFE